MVYYGLEWFVNEWPGIRCCESVNISGGALLFVVHASLV